MRITLALLLLTACAQETEPERAEQKSSAPPPAMAPAQPQPGQSSALMSIPEDPQALAKLEAMGYTIHEDHLHAPGVTNCPKMGNDPVV